MLSDLARAALAALPDSPLGPEPVQEIEYGTAVLHSRRLDYGAVQDLAEFITVFAAERDAILAADAALDKTYIRLVDLVVASAKEVCTATPAHKAMAERGLRIAVLALERRECGQSLPPKETP